MFVCHNKKFIFIDVPKTGSRSILHFLEENFQGNTTASHQIVIPSQYKDYFKFGVVRHPYDRMCSLWWSTSKRITDRHGYRKEMKQLGVHNTLAGFLEVLEHRMQKSNYQASWRTPAMHVIPQYEFVRQVGFDQILRFEHLEEDFNTLPFIDEPAILPKINTTTEERKNNPKRPPTEELVGEEEKATIQRLFDVEFDMFNYER